VESHLREFQSTHPKNRTQRPWQARSTAPEAGPGGVWPWGGGLPVWDPPQYRISHPKPYRISCIKPYRISHPKPYRISHPKPYRISHTKGRGSIHKPSLPVILFAPSHPSVSPPNGTWNPPPSLTCSHESNTSQIEETKTQEKSKNESTPPILVMSPSVYGTIERTHERPATDLIPSLLDDQNWGEGGSTARAKNARMVFWDVQTDDISSKRNFRRDLDQMTWRMRQCSSERRGNHSRLPLANKDPSPSPPPAGASATRVKAWTPLENHLGTLPCIRQITHQVALPKQVDRATPMQIPSRTCIYIGM